MGIISKIKSALLAPVYSRGRARSWVHEPYTGAWQKNDEWCLDDVSAFHAVYACITLIAADIGKCPFKVMGRTNEGVWVERTYRNVNKVLRRPNSYQNHIQFKQWWAMSKKYRGNAYILIVRDANQEIVALHVLDPDRVTCLVADDGSVFYQLHTDNLSGIEEGITVPESEIIHDRNSPIYHPLVGISPIHACGYAANQGLKIQSDSATFFANGARPGGILSAPGAISDETAKRLQKYWAENFTGANAGRIAVVGDALTFQQMRMTASDAQLIEQLGWTATVVCSAFKVPPYKIGIGDFPTNGDTATTEYYTRCLQIDIEEMEECLAQAFNLPDDIKVQLDLDTLFRMDSATFVRMLAEGVKGSLMAPNEGRRKLNLAPIEGGDTVYLQQQNYSLAALSKRDQREDPFAKSGAPSTPSADPVVSEEDAEDQAKILITLVRKELSLAHNART